MVPDVQPQWDEGESPLFDLATEIIDLRTVKEQLARPLRIVVVAAGWSILVDMKVVQPHLTV